MYNRYIPQDTDYVPAGQAEAWGGTGATPRREGPAFAARRGAAQPPSSGPGLSALLGGGKGLSDLLSPGREGGESALLRSLKLGDWDSGDLLLLLIILLLLAEGDDLELLIALGLALMMGLGEEKGESSP